MEQKNLRRRFAALLLMLCLLAAGALPALATSANIRLVDASGNPATGTIRVALYDSAKDKALSGGQLTLYRVAEVKRKNGDLSFEYCGDFYGCGIALGDLTDSTLADQLLEYMPQGARGTTKTVDADGNAAFEGSGTWPVPDRAEQGLQWLCAHQTVPCFPAHGRKREMEL